MEPIFGWPPVVWVARALALLALVGAGLLILQWFAALVARFITRPRDMIEPPFPPVHRMQILGQEIEFSKRLSDEVLARVTQLEEAVERLQEGARWK